MTILLLQICKASHTSRKYTNRYHITFTTKIKYTLFKGWTLKKKKKT